MSDEELAVEQESTDAAGEELTDEEQALAKLKEAISVEMEEIGPLRLKLKITVPQETLDERRGEEFAELKRDALVPGFRKGHAPLRLVEKRFAGDVGEQLKGQMISRGYTAAIEKEDIKPLGEPLFWVSTSEEKGDDDGGPREVDSEKLVAFDEALSAIQLPKQGPLTFACEIELKPTFELPELKGIPVERPKITVADKDVDEEVTRLRSMRGTFEPVEGGRVKADDLLYADLTITVEGRTIVEEQNCELAARDLRVRGIPLTGFQKAVVGKTAADRIELETAVPDDHETIDLRGKPAKVDVTLHEIKRLHLPAMDDALLASLGFDSKDELREQIRRALESRLGSMVQEAMREQIGKYLIDHTALEIPQGLSQRQTERSVTRRMIEMYQAGVPKAELEKRIDELRAGAHDQTVRDLKLYFVLDKIAEDREIEVGEEAVNSAIAQIAQRTNKRFDRVRDELSKGEGLAVLYHQLRDQRVLDELLKDAEVTEVTPKKKPAAAAKARKPSSAKKATAKKTKAKPKTAVRKSPKRAS